MSDFDSRNATMEHISNVGVLIRKVCLNLMNRSMVHDMSKLENPEKEIFDEYTPKLKGCTYGSDMYKRFLKEMKVGLDHHYAHNRHHPEYFLQDLPEYNGAVVDVVFERMTLFDIMEMLMDWKAASMRHADGDIMESIDLNQKRFGYSDTWVKIFKQTIKEMGADK